MRTKISKFFVNLITSGDILLDKYQVKKPLGDGSFGNVYQAYEIHLKQEYNLFNNLLAKN